MKIFRFLILNVILLFIIVFTISLFIPSHVRISRAVNMAAKANSVLLQVDNLNNWKNWYPGFDTLRIEPLQESNGRLVSARIPGNTYTIKYVKADEVIAEFSSGKTNPVMSGWKLISYNHTDSLTVQWYLDFKLRWYPWEKFTSLLYEKTYGVQMEKGLQELKKVAER